MSNSTFNLPNAQDHTIFACNNKKYVGKTNNGYAPRITGNFAFTDNDRTSIAVRVQSANGAFAAWGASGGELLNSDGIPSGTVSRGVSFNAGRSSQIYSGTMYGDRIVPASLYIPGFIIRY